MKKIVTLFCVMQMFFGSFFLLNASTINETESNDTEGTANAISLVFNGNVATDTILGAANTGGDIDYYSVTLSAGNTYLLSVDLYDSQHSPVTGSYTLDGKFYYKIGNGTWSYSYDSQLSEISVDAPTTVYFKVLDYYESTSTTGTYALTLHVNKITYTAIPLAFVSDVAIDTLDAEINPVGDNDFYSVTLPAGYNYNATVEVFDKYNFTGSIPYTKDVKVATKLGTDSWSSFYDNKNQNIIGSGSTTLYINVKDYYSSSTTTGTYGLHIIIKRSTNNFISINNKDFTFSSTINNDSTNIVCSGAWTAVSNQTWLTVTNPSGTGNSVLKFSAVANPTVNDRTATITVTTVGDNPAVVTINQDKYIAPDIYEPNNTEATSKVLDLGSFTSDIAKVSTTNANIHVRDNEDYYKLRLPAGYNYLVKTNLQDYNNSTDGINYTVNASLSTKHANGYYSSYNTIVCVGQDSVIMNAYSYYGIGTYKVEATIQRFSGDFISVSQNMVNVVKSGNTGVSIDIFSTTSWTISSDQTWVTLSKTSGSNISSFSFSVDANTGTVVRTATITLTAVGVTPVTITVNQEGDLVADSYETNDTEGTSYTQTLTFVNNVATFNTLGSNVHIAGDVDYYKLDLAAGFNYVISSELYDNWNEPNESRFTLDAAYYYKSNSGAWSSKIDYKTTSITLSNGGTVYFKVEPYFSGNLGSYSLTTTIERTSLTGINDLGSANNMKIFPNPSNGNFKVLLNNETAGKKQIKISDLSGKIVYTQQIDGGIDSTIDVNSNLPGGVYILEINGTKTNTVKRIIITK